MPWPGAGTNCSIGEVGAGLVASTEPVQSGFGEHDGVVVSVGQLAQSRVDVAAQLDDLEVGAVGQQL